MKAATIVEGQGIDAIELREIDVAPPAPGEAQVRLHCATINFRDLIVAKGLLIPSMGGITGGGTRIPMSCAAGVVTAVGEGVTRVKPGDRVSPIFAQSWLHGREPTMDMLGGMADGVARQLANFSAEGLVHNPDEIGDLEAATFACAGLTAWNALFLARPLQPGEWVLCHGTGGVSLAALQFAKAHGANVILTSSSDAKLGRGKALGADVTLNYRTDPNWAVKARNASGGVHIVIDVAGANQLDANVSALAPDGLISAIGMLSSTFSWSRIGQVQAQIVPVNVGNRDEHEAMVAFAAKHGIRPVVDVVYDLTRIHDAFRHAESGQFFGKVGINLL
ncbi:NAD(P)-dependent alcohol dehydrogenase [Novosphingobium sp.]|uniref:zinc-dependent alcohol dehydrogenase family protein n=1 Tax=Novosphingobium sp. TaxID=1874826 RepID=UPI00286E49A1|nr:NAD(P)-dependent alcohol dehydrogenase [Novosphingobium sp.]